MENSRETITRNLVCVLLVFLAGMLRLVIPYHTANYGISGMILVLFTAAILIWTIQLRRRLLSVPIRRHMTAAAGLMLLWMVLRTVKYEFFWDNYPMTRCLWYLYYVPMVFVPLHIFLAVLQIGRPKGRQPDRRWDLLYLAAAVLVILVLTNDLHQLAFRFRTVNPDEWIDKNYIHGPVYYAVAAWMAVLLFSTIVLVFFRCAVSSSRKKIWIPMVPVAVGILYTVLYLLKISNVLREMFRVPEIGCFLFATFMESLILIHLVPSNDSYSDFWNASSLGAVLMDEEGQVFCRSEHSSTVSPEQVKKALEQEITLEEGKLVLKSSRITGGYCYWTRDTSYVQSLNDRLEELGDTLEEENAMLKAEQKLRLERDRIRRQAAIYDDIAGSIRPQLDEISRILDAPARKEEDFVRQMKYACVLNVFVKRYSNLLLLSRQRESLECGELWLAISESLNYAELYGIKAHGTCRGSALLPGSQILMLYQLFEYILESVIPGASAFLADLDLRGDGAALHITAEAPGRQLTEEILREYMPEFPGLLSVEREEQTEYMTIFLPTGRELI